jgi:DNA-binding beta-propeller fold protein YncE
MDYLAFDAQSGLLFVPAGGSGNLDVVDTKTGKVTALGGWPTARRGSRTTGISAAATGGGFVYVGNRADSTICAVEIASLAKKGCVKLDGSPDGVFYVAPTREVWVTTPRDKSLQVLSLADPGAPAKAASITLDGEPEGYAVDEKRGLVFTNLEDKNQTLAIDAKSRKVTATWATGCGERGPRGLVVDAASAHVVVACNQEGLRVLDAEGKLVGQLATGGGVDNIDWLPEKRLVFASSAAEGKLTVAKLGADGALTQVHSAPTVQGGRTVIVDAAGTAYVPDSKKGRLVVVKQAP